MSHQKYDRVTNTVPVGPDIPVGTPGTVTKTPEPPFNSYDVRFDTHSADLSMDPHEIKAKP